MHRHSVYGMDGGVNGVLCARISIDVNMASSEVVFEWEKWTNLSRMVPIPNELLDWLKLDVFPVLVEHLVGTALYDTNGSSSATETVVKVLTICRNCCGHKNSVMPDFLITCNIPDKLFKFSRRISIFNKVEQCFEEENTKCASIHQDIDINIKQRIISVVMQLFANFTAASDDGCNYLVQNHKQHFSDLFAAALSTGNRRIISTGISMLFNCLCSAKTGFQLRRDALFTERLLFCQIFLAMYPQKAIGSHVILDDDPVSEWLTLLVSEMVFQSHEYILYNLLGSLQGNIFNLEQLTFLYILFSLNDESSNTVSTRDWTLLLTVCKQLQQVFPLLQKAGGQSDSSRTHVEILNDGQNFDFALVAMDYVSKILCQNPDMSEVRQILVKEYSLVKTLCSYLRFHQSEKCEQPDIINALLQLMSNLIYRCPSAQVMSIVIVYCVLSIIDLI